MAIWEQFRKRGQKTYCQVRSSGALAAPYPLSVYSDLYDHRQYIRVLVNSGFSGLLWCPEVRDAASEEDLIRRLQSVVFSPLAQVDCWSMKISPLATTGSQKEQCWRASRSLAGPGIPLSRDHRLAYAARSHI